MFHRTHIARLLTKFARGSRRSPLPGFTRHSAFSTAIPDDDEKDEPAKPSRPPSILPGIGLSAATALGGFQGASLISSATGVPLSGIPVAILLGMTLRNTVGFDDSTYKQGIAYGTKTILQGGIVCVAAKLSFLELLTTGSTGLAVVVSSVGAGLLYIPMVGRLVGLPREMSLLLTAGTSICGVTAITALAPAIKAPNRDIAVAVANTVAFGTLGMLAYPYLFHMLCTTSEQTGMCLGVAIHDTSQVLGAALSYKEAFGDEVAFKIAAVTKLMRNLGLAVAIPALTYSYHAAGKGAAADAGKDKKASRDAKISSTMSGLQSFTKYVPPFLMAFVGVSALRSTLDMVLGTDVETYKTLINLVGNDLSKYALGTAMAGVGLSTSTSSLRGVGWKPFAVGGSGALVVGGTGFTIDPAHIVSCEKLAHIMDRHAAMDIYDEDTLPSSILITKVRGLQAHSTNQGLGKIYVAREGHTRDS